MTKHLEAYDADDQDRTPSDFTTVKLANARAERAEAEVARLRGCIAELEAEREESSQFATERNAELNELRREVEGLRARLAVAEGRPNL